MFTNKSPFRLATKERKDLESIVRSTLLAAGWVRRAQVLLLLAEGLSVRAIQAQTGMSPHRQRHWRRRFEQQVMDGLLDADRSGRPKNLGAAKEAAILAATEQGPSPPVTHWSTRRLARRVGVSHSTVMRVWHKAGLQPHRLQRYLASPDPNFEAKAKAVSESTGERRGGLRRREDGHSSLGSNSTGVADASRSTRTPDGGVRPARNGLLAGGFGSAHRQGAGPLRGPTHQPGVRALSGRGRDRSPTQEGSRDLG